MIDLLIQKGTLTRAALEKQLDELEREISGRDLCLEEGFGRCSHERGWGWGESGGRG